jgi:hypothetical protein
MRRTRRSSQFGSGGDNPPLLVVVRLPPGRTVNSSGVRGRLATVFGKASPARPGARAASWVSTGNRAFVSADGRTTFELVYPVPGFSGDPYAAALFSSPPAGAITLWVPLAVFALLFGLSMDYGVFILSRITEEYSAAAAADAGRAVVRGIGRTGRLVTSGALILPPGSCTSRRSPRKSLPVTTTPPVARVQSPSNTIPRLLRPESTVKLYRDTI